MACKQQWYCGEGVKKSGCVVLLDKSSLSLDEMELKALGRHYLDRHIFDYVQECC